MSGQLFTRMAESDNRRAPPLYTDQVSSNSRIPASMEESIIPEDRNSCTAASPSVANTKRSIIKDNVLRRIATVVRYMSPKESLRHVFALVARTTLASMRLLISYLSSVFFIG